MAERGGVKTSARLPSQQLNLRLGVSGLKTFKLHLKLVLSLAFTGYSDDLKGNHCIPQALQKPAVSTRFRLINRHHDLGIVDNLQ